MATHQITIAKASKNDFEKVYNLLSPMEELFNNRWSNEESWTEWDDDNEDKLELLAIRKEIAEEVMIANQHYTKRILHSGLTNIKYLNLVILPTFHHEKDSSANII